MQVCSETYYVQPNVSQLQLCTEASEDPISIHEATFDTVKMQYELPCPGCDFKNKPEIFNQESSTDEQQLFLCKIVSGIFC